MPAKRCRTGGFTLIEVTLAIVIGVVMIAGAVLIYNQAKTSAGNSRAQAKAVSLQQLVEEYAANNQGTYPEIESVRALYKRKRPDDYLKSPWGGQVGVDLQNQADVNGTRGIADNSTSKGTGSPSTGNADTSTAAPWRGDGTNAMAAPGTANTVSGINKTPDGSVPLQDRTKAGGLSYSLNDRGGGSGANLHNNTETEPVWDVITNRIKIFRGYVVWVYDQSGKYPNFVAGGTAGPEASTTAGGGLRD